MSYGNLKDFYNSNKFNKKLRERVNGFEPELSGSLWDRIEHDLDKKDNKHRRILALVYVLAGLLLLSSAGMLYFYNQQRIAKNYLSENTNTPAVQQVPAAGSDKSAPAVNNNNETSSNSDLEADSDLENEGAIAFNGNASVSSNTTGNPATNRRPAATQTGNETNTENPVVDQEQIAQNNPVESVESSEIIPAEEEAKEAKEAEDKPKEGAKEDSKETAEKPAKADKKDPSKKVRSDKGKWFVGAFYGYGQSNTAVSSANAGLYSYENPLNVPEYGIEFSRRFNNFFIGSGVHFLETGEKLTYKYTPVTAVSTIPVPSVQDSIIPGDSLTAFNYQSWIQIPLNLGYILDIGKFSVQGSVGMAYTMNTGYSGLEPNYGFSGFDPAGTFGNQYKSHFNFLGSLGIGYRITPRFSFVLAADYRKAVTSATKNDRPNHAVRYPEFMGGKVSVFYRLRSVVSRQ